MIKAYVTRIVAVLVLSTPLLTGCGDVNYNWDLPTMENPNRSWPGPFQLKLSLDASFQYQHGGHDVRIAVVRRSDGATVAAGGGRISADQNPAFTFSSGAELEAGAHYEVHYWIDSNIGGGTRGVCDGREIDHQWSIELFFVFNDRELTVSHHDALTEDVCSTFVSFPIRLTFS
jgi:hypothetical protein